MLIIYNHDKSGLYLVAQMTQLSLEGDVKRNNGNTTVQVTLRCCLLICDSVRTARHVEDMFKWVGNLFYCLSSQSIRRGADRGQKPSDRAMKWTAMMRAMWAQRKKACSWTFKSSIISVRLDNWQLMTIVCLGRFDGSPPKLNVPKQNCAGFFHTMSWYHWTWAKHVVSCHIMSYHSVTQVAMNVHLSPKSRVQMSLLFAACIPRIVH